MSNMMIGVWKAKLADLTEVHGYTLERPPVGQYARLVGKDGEHIMLEADGRVRPLRPEEMGLPVEKQQALDVQPEFVPAEDVPTNSFEVNQVLGMPKELVVNLNGRMFVTQAGLLIKAEKKGGYKSMHAEISQEIREDNKLIGYEARGYIFPVLSPQDMELLKMVKEFPEDLRKDLMAQVGRPYTAIATATTKNVKMTAMHSYLRELACTRALNRALRLYTACGFTSAEELDDAVEVE
jgi:hypothetical protein